jgi:hypothetical protein
MSLATLAILSASPYDMSNKVCPSIFRDKRLITSTSRKILSPVRQSGSASWKLLKSEGWGSHQGWAFQARIRVKVYSSTSGLFWKHSVPNVHVNSAKSVYFLQMLLTVTDQIFQNPMVDVSSAFCPWVTLRRGLIPGPENPPTRSNLLPVSVSARPRLVMHGHVPLAPNLSPRCLVVVICIMHPHARSLWQSLQTRIIPLKRQLLRWTWDRSCKCCLEDYR